MPKRRLLTGGEIVRQDVIKIDDMPAFLAGFEPENVAVLCSGDGTLNRFADSLGGEPPVRVMYFATGTGNDFLNDIGGKPGDAPVIINDYLKNLPTVTVNGRTSRFINGIDGYCCEEGDRLRAKSDKPVDYTSIAIKGLLFHFRPANAVVTVDGKEHRFRKVWLAPTMHGRFYGGGMMTAPDQKRNNPDGTVTLVVLHGSGKLKTLIVFPSIFKGEHVKHKKMVSVFIGHEITVRFDRPTALQIDGETVSGVTEYSVSSGATAAQTEA